MRRDAVTIDDDESAMDDVGRRRLPWGRLIAGLCWPMVIASVVFTLVRVFGWERTWFVDTFLAFTPYVALLLPVPVIVAVFQRRWRAATVAGLMCLALATVFVGRFIGHPDPGSGPRLSVMSTNMKIGAADPATIVGLVRSNHVDLLAVEEFTQGAQDALAGRGLDELLPYRAVSPSSGAIGSAIYSRYPLTDFGYQSLAGGFGQEYATVHVPGALPLAFYAVHTRAPVGPGTDGEWARSIAQQPAATPKGVMRLLAGDFNATLDHARLRDLLGTGYRDVASELGDGMAATWPYDGRLIPPITLDHMFADPRIGVGSFATSKVAGTDHKAILAVLTLPAA